MAPTRAADQGSASLVCPLRGVSPGLQALGGGAYWPVRQYYWGTCEAFNTQHSDCTFLKKLLLEVRLSNDIPRGLTINYKMLYFVVLDRRATRA